jgi:hypothetical protein
LVTDSSTRRRVTSWRRGYGFSASFTSSERPTHEGDEDRDRLSEECGGFWGKKQSKRSAKPKPSAFFSKKLRGAGFYPTSRKNTNVKTQAKAWKLAETAQGRKYGYLLRNSEFPKVSGKRSAGRDNEPPIVGLQTINGRSVLLAEPV